jgi:hypothetical protein
MACTIEQKKAIYEQLLRNGYAKEDADAVITLITERDSDPTFSNKIDDLVTDFLTDEDKAFLRETVDELTSNISKVIEGGFVYTFKDLISRMLPAEKADRLATLLSKIRIAEGDVNLFSLSQIENIDQLITMNRNLGREEVLPGLYEKRNKIQEKLDRERVYDGVKDGEKKQKRDSALNKLNQLKQILTYIEYTINVATPKDVRAKLRSYAMIKANIKNLENTIKASKKLLNRFKEGVKGTKERKAEIKELEKQLTEARASEKALLQELIDEKVVELGGKDSIKIRSVALARDQVTAAIEKEAAKLESLDSAEISELTVASATTLANQLAQERLAAKNIKNTVERMNNLVDFFEAESVKNGGAENEIDHLLMHNMVGKPIVEYYLRRREKREADDKEAKPIDRTLFTKEQAKEIIKEWERIAWRGVESGTFADNVTTVMDSELNLLEAIITQNGVANPLETDINNLVVKQDRTGSEALLNTNIGVIPDENKASTARQLSSWLEYTIRGLYSLRASPYYNGTISSKAVDMVLHPRLYDLSINSDDLGLVSKRKRKLGEAGKTLYVSKLQDTLKDLGIANPETLPEFQPDFDNRMDAVSYDIETDLTDKTTGNPSKILSMQVRVQDKSNAKEPVTFIFSNTDDSGIPTNSKDLPTGTRKPLNKQQIEYVLNFLEGYQNNGFKLVTFAGNHFDLGKLVNFVDNKNLVSRVALRSYDLQRNLGFDNTEREKGGAYYTSNPKNANLKSLAQNNLPPIREISPDGRYVITNGAVLRMSDDKKTETEVTGAEAEANFNLANADGDWALFDLYAENDVVITLGLFNHFMGSQKTIVTVKDKRDSSKDYTIVTSRPRSNMMLPINSSNIHSTTLGEIMAPFGNTSSDLKNFVLNVEYTEELDINLDKLISLVEGWYMQALAMDPESKDRVNELQKALTEAVNVDTIVQQTGKNIARRMADAVKKSAKKNFDTFGYVLSLRLHGDGTIAMDVAETKPGVFEINEAEMYNGGSKDEYIETIAISFVDALSTSRQLDTVFTEFAESFGIPPVGETESPQRYVRENLVQVLKNYISIDSLSDFGDGTIDWHPATDVGRALAHVFTDRKEGMSLVDTQSLMNTEKLSKRNFISKEATNRGVPRYFLLDGANFASPWGITEEALIYDNFRLLTRVKDIMERDLTDKEIDEIMKWAETAEDTDPNVSLSVFRRGSVPGVFPKVTSRGPYDFLPDLSERELLGQEFLFDIPRAMMFINHDAFYTPLAQKGRWLTKGSVYYAEDFFTAGAPTAKMILSGAVDHTAWLVSFDMLDPNNKHLRKLLQKALSDGYDAIVADPTVQDMGNKSDYSYHGVHVQLMLALAYQKQNLSVFNDFIAQFLNSVDTANEPNVRRNLQEFKEKNDPREKLNDYLITLLEQAKKDGESFKAAFKISEEELVTFVQLGEFLGIDRPERKEFLKGIITPAMYDAGFDGIFEGILDKIDKEGMDLGLNHASIAAKIVLREAMKQNATYVEKAIGIMSKAKDGQFTKDMVIKAIMDMSSELDNEKIKESFDKNKFGEKDTKTRLDAAEKYLNAFVNMLAQKGTSVAGLNDKQRDDAINASKEKLRKVYQERINKAAAIMAKHDMSNPGIRSDPKIQDEINIALMGDKKAYETHLMLFTLAKRAATPFKMFTDAETVAMHSALAGQYIDESDIMPFVGKTLFHAMGSELASGRHHMFGSYDFGPQGPKEAQIRVLHGKEKNKYGIWDINEVYESKEREQAYRKAYAMQIMLDLVPNYYHPGYDPDKESMENYFDAMKKRSNLERLAQVNAIRTLEQANSVSPNDPEYENIQETAKKLRKSGFEERLTWVRNSYGRDNKNPVVLDPTVSGLAALRPRYANMDYTQRGMYALIEVMKSREIRQNEMFQKKKLLTAAPQDGDPNSIIPSRFRGFEKTTDKKNLPYIPHQTGNMVTSLVMSPNRETELEAIKLRNSLTYFATQNGLESLLENKEWTRLWMIREWRRQGLEKSVNVMKDQINNGILDMFPSRIAMYESVFKLMGTNARAYSPGQTYSVLDLMAKPEEIRFTTKEMDELRKNFPDGLRYMDLLRHLSTRFDRLEGLKPEFPLVLEPGLIVRGEQGLIKGTPTYKALSVFNIETNNNTVMMLMMSDLFEKEAQEVYRSDPDFDKFPRDSAGNLVLSMLPADKLKSEEILDRVLKKAPQLAAELGTQKGVYFVLHKEHLDGMGKIAKELVTPGQSLLDIKTKLTNMVHVFSQVNNPDTLWYFTPDMVIQFLNSLRNNPVISAAELSWQTHKTVGFANTETDILVLEQQKQLMDNVGRSVDLTHQALVLLHTVDPSSNENAFLYRNNYRRKDAFGKPSATLDATMYLGKTFDMEVTVGGKSRMIKNVPLETAVYATDILAAMSKARKLGMDKEADELGEFLLAEMQNSSVKIETNKALRINNTQHIVIKAAVLKSRLEGIKSNRVEGVKDTIMSTLQTEITQEAANKVYKAATRVSRLLQKIADAVPGENQQMTYVAHALLSKMENTEDGIEDNTEIQNKILDAVGVDKTDRERSKSVRAIINARQDLTTVPEDRPFTHLPWDARKDVAKFADRDEFINAFGDAGRGIVAQLDGMVAMKLMSRRVADMKMILIGSLASINPNILSDLALEAMEFDGHTYAKMAKLKGKYTIGLNIKAMETTPENEMLLKFAEELVHLARVKYMAEGSNEYRKIQAIFRTPNSEEMIREMLFAMNRDKPYAAIEADVRYAMEHTDEFLAHWGAVVLLAETVYSEETMSALEAKYTPVEMLNTWYKKAFFRIKSIAVRSLKMVSQIAVDPKYAANFNEMYNVMQGIIGQGMATRVDAGNPDTAFNAVKSIRPNSTEVTPSMVTDLQRLSIELRNLNNKIAKKIPLSPTEKMRLIEIEDITNNKEMNPHGILDMTEFDVIREMENVNRAEDGAIVRLETQPLTERAVLQRGLTNHLAARGSRIDQNETFGGLFRNIASSLGLDDFVSLTIQNKLLASINDSQLTYNSPEGILVLISEMIDNTTVTTESSYRPSSIGGGFEFNKEGLKGYVGDIWNVATGIDSKYKSTVKKEEVSNNTALILNSLPTTTTDLEIRRDAERLAEKIKLFNGQLRSLLVKSRIKDRGDNLDPIGLKTRRSTKLNREDKDRGRKAVVNAMRTKYTNNLTTNGVDAVVNPFMLFISGNMLDPSMDTIGVSSSEFAADLRKFTDNPNDTADNAREAMAKQIVNDALSIKLGREKNYNASTTLDDVKNSARINPGYLNEDVIEATRRFIIRTRENTQRFSTAFKHLSKPEIELIVKSVIETVSQTRPDSLTAEKIRQILDNRESFGYYQGLSPYIPESHVTATPMDILADQFLGKLGATAYLFSEGGPDLTYKDIFLDPVEPSESGILQVMFEKDLSNIQQSLMRGQGYDAIQRIVVQKTMGIEGAYFSISQLIDMFKRQISMESSAEAKRMGVRNFDNRGDDETRATIIMRGLERLDAANQKAKETLGTRLEGKPLIDFLNKYGPMATTLTYGPNAALATSLVEGTMSTVNELMRGHNPFTFLIEAIRMNVETSVGTASRVVSRRDGRFSWFNVDPYVLSKVAENALWMFEETTSPMIPGQLVSNALSTAEIEDMSRWDRFLAFSRRSYSDPMRSLRVAAENQANRGIYQRLHDGSLLRLRDSVNKILRDNPSPSNQVYREVARDAGVRMDVELMAIYVRSGIFEPGVIETLNYARSSAPPETGKILFSVMADLEAALPPGGVIYDGVVITPERMLAARTTLASLSRQYAGLSIVMDHPLDGTAAASATNVVITFFKSYPALFMAQHVMRQGTITPMLRHGARLLLHGMLDMIYNILLALSSGWYKWEKLMDHLEKGTISKAEATKLFLRHPVFSMNILGIVTQSLSKLALPSGRDNSMISSVGEVALAQQVSNIFKAAESWYYYAYDKVPAESAAASTYSALRGALSFIPGNTMVRLTLQQAFGQAGTTGTAGTASAKTMRYIDRLTDERPVLEAVRSMFPGGLKNPKRTVSEEPRQIKMTDIPKVRPPSGEPQPKVTTPTTRSPSIQEQATTPLKAPSGL